MDELKELKERLSQERPAQWRDLPDIGLYMDQVVSYMPRQLISYAGRDALTPAMVNNYIKDGLLPRADGKKYGRTHLAYLTAICALKRVLSVRETKALLHAGRAPQARPPAAAEGEADWALYAKFLGQMDMALERTADALDPDTPREELAGLALSLALRSYADQLACQRILDLIAPQEATKAERKRRVKEG